MLRKEDGDAGLKLPERKSPAGKHQQENYWCTLTYEEQIKYYEDTISKVEYDRDEAMELDRTLYQIRQHMGESDEDLNLSIIEASK